MSVELHAVEGRTRTAIGEEPEPDGRGGDDRRPNVSGDLPALFQAAPMFRRTVAGYDRFQVDTYVQWAEDELATAQREREHLVERHLRTQAALAETRELLSHSASGSEFLQTSRRIGALLATAADEAESLRADAEADRLAASAEAGELTAAAEQRLADAAIQAERLVSAAVDQAAATNAEARRVALEAEAAAEQVRRAGHAEAESRLQSVRVVERRAAEQAEEIRRRATEAAAAALLAARDEVVRMLGTAREERRRADAEAAAVRERQEQEVVARYAALRQETASLERRRSLLQAEIARLSATTADPAPAPAPAEALLPRFLDAVRTRSRSLPH